MRVNRDIRLNVALFGFLTLLLTLASSLYFSANSKFSNISFHLEQGSLQPIEFPYKANTSNRYKSFTVSASIEHGGVLGSTTFTIVPDDCLAQLLINGQDVDLSTKISGSLCDYQNGFRIDLSRYLQPGKNEFLFHIKDHGGKRALDVRPEITPIITYFFIGTLLLWVAFGSFFVMRQLSFSYTIALLFAIGMMIRIVYMLETPWNVRTYDVVGGHINYIAYIATHGAIPEAKTCWTCYHPPLYYVIAAGVYKVGLLFGKMGALGALQGLSLIFSSGFLIMLLLILKSFIRNHGILVVASIVIIFIPSMVFHSIRIGNDVLLYFTYSGALYFYLKWLKTSKGLWASTLFAIASVFVKSNGVLIMGILGISFLIKVLMENTWRSQLKTMLVIITIYAVAVGAAIGVHMARSDGGLVSNKNALNSQLFVPNTAFNYIYFDTKLALQEPFSDPWHDGKGRKYFWNFLLQTSLFGEFQHQEHLKSLGSLITVLWLAIITSAIFGMLLLRREQIKEYIPIIVNAVVLVMAAIYLRVSIPAACSGDFRYSMPLLLFVALFSALFIEKIRSYGLLLLEWGMVLVVVSFGLFSILMTMLV